VVTTIAPYGAWVSQITAETATTGMTAGQIGAPVYVGTVGAEVW
jgi:hypothetical protein